MQVPGQNIVSLVVTTDYGCYILKMVESYIGGQKYKVLYEWSPTVPSAVVLGSNATCIHISLTFACRQEKCISSRIVQKLRTIITYYLDTMKLARPSPSLA